MHTTVAETPTWANAINRYGWTSSIRILARHHSVRPGNGDPERAIEDFDAVIMNPRHAYAYGNRGCRFASGNSRSHSRVPFGCISMTTTIVRVLMSPSDLDLRVIVLNGVLDIALFAIGIPARICERGDAMVRFGPLWTGQQWPDQSLLHW